MYTSMFIVLWHIESVIDLPLNLHLPFAPFFFFLSFPSSKFLQENVESLYDGLICPFIIRSGILLRGILG